MTLNLTTFLIVCPLVFLAGFVDSIGGGGGLISLPAYMLAGIPAHMAVGTNKLSASIGSVVSTGAFVRKKLVNYKIAVPSVICAIVGASLGANLSLLVDEAILGKVLIPVLVISAFFVLNKRIFKDGGVEVNEAGKKVYIVASIAALIIGMYDGFYGPGAGTFLIIAFNVFAKINIKSSNAQAKVINLTTNFTSLAVYLINSQVILPLGLTAAVFNMAGCYIGSNLAISKGSKITRPVIIVVLVLLFIKVASEML